MLSHLIKLAEKGVLPDFLIRIGIRKLCKVRLDYIEKSGPEITWDRSDLARRNRARTTVSSQNPVYLFIWKY